MQQIGLFGAAVAWPAHLLPQVLEKFRDQPLGSKLSCAFFLLAVEPVLAPDGTSMPAGSCHTISSWGVTWPALGHFRVRQGLVDVIGTLCVNSCVHLADLASIRRSLSGQPNLVSTRPSLVNELVVGMCSSTSTCRAVTDDELEPSMDRAALHTPFTVFDESKAPSQARPVPGRWATCLRASGYSKFQKRPSA